VSEVFKEWLFVPIGALGVPQTWIEYCEMRRIQFLGQRKLFREVSGKRKKTLSQNALIIPTFSRGNDQNWKETQEKVW